MSAHFDSRDPKRFSGGADCREGGAHRPDGHARRVNGKVPARGPRGIFARFAIRSLKLNRSRTIVSIIGIALSCALITAIFTSVTSLLAGLLTAELNREGSWQVDIVNVPESQLEAISSDTRVEDVYLDPVYGQALMPLSFQGYFGRYLNIQEWPTKDAMGDLAPLPVMSEGRAPEGPGEIALPLELKNSTVEVGLELFGALPDSGKDADAPRAAWEGKLALNSSIDLALGQRFFHDDRRGTDRACIPGEALYTTEGADGGDVISEWLGNVGEPERYTVVGFYDTTAMDSSSAWQSGSYIGFVGDSGLAPYTYNVLLNTNLTSLAAINGLIGDYTDLEYPLFNSGGNTLKYQDVETVAYDHNALLRYQGMLDERSIWGTLYSLAAILSGVVMVASVSLIYNSFAIAVGERTRQFGLLSSLGASKRQLRRTVYAEALALSAIGIPLGIAIGLLGTWAVFSFEGEGIGMMIDAEVFAEKGMSSITVNPVVLGISALIALVTVLISAAVPARRASRVSAIDAIRQAQNVKMSRAERRRARRAERATGNTAGRTSRGLTGRIDALRIRLLGIPGFLAHRNLTRSTSKARVAVASLAVSVALLITSGSIQHYMGYLSTVADSGGRDIEVTLNRSLTAEETTADGIAAIDAAFRELGKAPTATPVGYVLNSSVFGSFEPGVIDAAELMQDDDQYDMPDRVKAGDGTIYSPISMIFLDNDTWADIVKAEGLDEELFCDPSAPRAIGLNGSQSNDGKRYSLRDLFLSGGTATIFTQLEGSNDMSMTGFEQGAGGEVLAQYLSWGGDTLEETSTTRPLGDVLRDTFELPVGAIVDDRTPELTAYGSIWPTLILPASALPTLAQSSEGIQATSSNGLGLAPFAFHSAEGASGMSSIYAFLSFDAEDPKEAEAHMRSILDSELNNDPWHRVYLNNNAENVRQATQTSQTIQIFISCFVVITTAIAVANVFNTLSSSIMLRRREFAMLKSIGMGGRAFRRMIALECLSYAWRGMAIGLVLGAGVTLLVYQAMSMSFAGLGFELPLAWVLAAFGVVVGVLALSTVYALRKSRADSIVQTLREDAI